MLLKMDQVANNATPKMANTEETINQISRMFTPQINTKATMFKRNKPKLTYLITKPVRIRFISLILPILLMVLTARNLIITKTTKLMSEPTSSVVYVVKKLSIGFKGTSYPLSRQIYLNFLSNTEFLMFLVCFLLKSWFLHWGQIHF